MELFEGAMVVFYQLPIVTMCHL